MASIVNDIKYLLGKHHEVHFLHTGRRANGLVHALAAILSFSKLSNF